MGNRGWIKRVLPFFATFAVGIFIASLFGFGGPRFGRHGRWERRMEFERLRTENEELKNENLRLRNESCDEVDRNVEFDGSPKMVLPVNPPIILGDSPGSAMHHHHPPRRDK